MNCKNCLSYEVCKHREKMEQEYEAVAKLVTFGEVFIRCAEYLSGPALEIPSFPTKKRK